MKNDLGMLLRVSLDLESTDWSNLMVPRQKHADMLLVIYMYYEARVGWRGDSSPLDYPDPTEGSRSRGETFGIQKKGLCRGMSGMMVAAYTHLSWTYCSCSMSGGTPCLVSPSQRV